MFHSKQIFHLNAEKYMLVNLNGLETKGCQQTQLVGLGEA